MPTIRLLATTPWVALLSVLLMPSAQAETVVSNTSSEAVDSHSGLCMGLKGNSTAAGALVQAQTCNQSAAQTWKYVRDSAGYYQVINSATGQCLDVPGATTALDNNLQQWGCSGADNQKWNLSDQGNGQFALIAKGNDLALTVYAGGTSNGSRIVQSTWAATAQQRWKLPSATVNGSGPSSGSVLTLKGVDAGNCIGVAGNSTAAGTVLQSQTCANTTFQQWKAVRDAAGDYTLSNVGSGQCMDVPGASTVGGADIQQWGCSGADWQKWRFSEDGSGHYYITAKSSGLSLDVEGASNASGASIIQYRNLGKSNQQWTATAVSGGSSGGSTTGPVGFAAGVTGGQGGSVVTVTTPEQLKAALCGSQSNSTCTDNTRRIIRVSGMIDFRGTEGNQTEVGCTYSNNSCSVNGKSERILAVQSYCSGRSTYKITFDAAGKTPLLVGSNKTLIGVGANSGIKGKGLHLRGGVSNIVIRNLSFTDINDGVIWAGDALTIDNASGVWIDHNYFARIGRQMIVTGWGTAQRVTISDNFFDGTTDYGHYCNGKHYWVMLLLAENQTITLVGNRLHNTSGRSPETGKSDSAASGGIVHLVNNYYDGNYYFGLDGTPATAALLEGNYYGGGDYFFPILTDSTSDLVFAPLSDNLTQANSSCSSILGRACVANSPNNLKQGNTTASFKLSSGVMSRIQATSGAVAAIKSIQPLAPASLPGRSTGPQASISN